MDVSTFLKGLKQTKNQRATHDTERDTTAVDVSSDTFSDGSEDSQHNDDDGDMIGGTHRAKRSASKYQGAKVAALFDPLQVVASNALTSSQPRASMDSVRARLVRPRQQDSAKRFREESVDFLRGELEKKRRVAERELIAPQESSIDVSEVDTALLDTIDSLLAENLKEGTSGHLDDTATFHNTGSSHEPPQDENAAETKDEEPASTNEPLPAPSKPKRRTTMFERATML